jgi:hypothetical protein
MQNGRRPGSLLEELQDLIERTYDMERSVSDIGGFVIGDEGYRRLTARRRVVHRVGTAAGVAGPAVLVRQEEGKPLHASLYYPDWLIRTLERHPPLRWLDRRNLAEFGLFVEELDHLLFLADRARYRVPVSLVEMEFHANVTKELVVRWLYGRHRRRERLSRADRRWVRRHLYDRDGFDHLRPPLRRRYEDAERLATAFFAFFDRLPRPARLRELRRFHRRDWRAHRRFLSGRAGPAVRGY